MDAQQRKRINIARAQTVSQNHGNALPPAADPAYLAALAERLAQLCGLPLALAQARVARLAISAKPSPLGDGFKARIVG